MKHEIMIPESAVLLITFNRSDNTREVFRQIKQAKIKKLYVANDGPREGNENDIIERERIKLLLQEVDWDCELHTLFQEKNLGCGWGPATAITWAFEKEDRLVVLEDDCVPALAFFPFCNEMLERYKDDNRIWRISGRSCFPDADFFAGYDYIFTHYAPSWGWATWKRCWDHFDMNMLDITKYLPEGGAENYHFSTSQAAFSNYMLRQALNDKNLTSHIWDIQFAYLHIKNNGLGIVPRKNLIKNIGYIGTHFNKVHKFHLLDASNEYRVVNHPSFVITNNKYDKYYFKYSIRKLAFIPYWLELLLRKMKTFVKRIK